MKRLLAGLLFFSTLGATSVSVAQNCGIYPAKSVTILRDGGRVDWSRTHGLIAYDAQRDPDGEGRELFFRIRVMRIQDGQVVEDDCLTCNASRRPRGLRKHNGNPAWHPAGEHIVFQALMPESDAPNAVTRPGHGVDNVLWLTNRQGTRFWQLTWPDPHTPATGVLHAHFSPNGDRLSWTELYEAGEPGVEGKAAGYWRLKVAPFSFGEDGRPQLGPAENHEPGGQGFYENHGFSPDGSKLLFSSNVGRSGLAERLNNDIFTLELRPGGTMRQLTFARYNEHASYTPSAAGILWMSNRGNLNLGTDLWLMPTDGTDAQRQRVTAFNQWGCAETERDRVVAADHSINAEGDQILLYVQDEIGGGAGTVRLIDLRPEALP
jgi:Tol biopolymer transport system component